MDGRLKISFLIYKNDLTAEKSKIKDIKTTAPSQKDVMLSYSICGHLHTNMHILSHLYAQRYRRINIKNNCLKKERNEQPQTIRLISVSLDEEV